jgi:hypothetical protein
MPNELDIEAYDMAQEAVTLMKGAILRLLAKHPEGLKATDIGRMLGVNGDAFAKGQEGWFQWTILKIMEAERTVEQVKDRGPWRIKLP